MSDITTLRPPSPLSTPLPPPARVDGASLFAGKREVVIVHQGEEYRLRITKQQKLILTK